MADGEVLVADQDLAHDEPDDVFALFDGELVGVGDESGAESFERLGELEVRLGVVQLGVECVDVGTQCGLVLSQLGSAGAQLLACDQLLLLAVDQPPQRILGASQVALRPSAALAGWMGRVERLKPAIDLGLDQGRVVEQREHRAPDELVDLAHPRGPVVAHASLGATRAVGPRQR